jgi:hypothetical protein
MSSNGHSVMLFAEVGASQHGRSPLATPHHTTPAALAPRIPPSQSSPPNQTKAERRLEEEVERVRSYLDESTEPKIIKVAETELIQEQVSNRVSNRDE